MLEIDRFYQFTDINRRISAIIGVKKNLASFQFGPWVLWAILLLISTWQKGLLKASESPEMAEEHP